MLYRSRHRSLVLAACSLLAILLVLGGVWLLVRDSGPADGPAASPAEPSTSPEAPSITEPGRPPASPAATMTVTVFFHRGPNADPTKVVAVHRRVPRTAKIGTASLEQLLAGPTRAERRSGYWSLFSSKTEDALRSLRVSDGVAHADFHDFRSAVPSAGSSAGTAALLAELDHTLKQFTTVRRTLYSLEGDVAAFYEWLQLSPPDGPAPTLAQARRVARDFLHRVAAMPEPVSVAARWRSDFIATADFRSRISGAASNRGPVTTVVLGKGRETFSVLAATTPTIRVDAPVSAISPGDLQVVTSPVTVAGSALAFEGNVSIRVVEAAGQGVRELGTGTATGGGDVMRSFTAAVQFRRPGAETGWVLVSERSALNGAVTKVTAVRVAFASTPS